MLFKTFRFIVWFLVFAFAFVGLVLVVGFIALRFGWTNTPGQVDLNDRYFRDLNKTVKEDNIVDPKILAQKIAEDNRRQLGNLADYWHETPEWSVLKEAIIKDQDDIIKASAVAGIPPRLLVSMLVGEQLRLYNSEREIYKQFFQPLKILGNQSKFSWGVMGMKEETAKQVEINLQATSSPFYLGVAVEHLLDFETADPDAERFNRLVDEHNHYYSYLYSALYLKQLMAQWQRAGYNIDNRPEIIATLFNLGFNKSVPKVDPAVGGAEIDIGNQKYSFGSLAFQFYYSQELINNFPWQ